MIPEYISHYYLDDRAPFLSKSYLETRKRCESKLRDIFVSRGGTPNREYPYYCVLGSSDWFFGLNDKHRELRIPLNELNEGLVSFTYPDSFIAMSDATKPYYEKVYMLSELSEMINTYGLPKSKKPASYEKYWEADFEHYIEVQIWCDSIVESYR